MPRNEPSLPWLGSWRYCYTSCGCPAPRNDDSCEESAGSPLVQALRNSSARRITRSTRLLDANDLPGNLWWLQIAKPDVQ